MLFQRPGDLPLFHAINYNQRQHQYVPLVQGFEPYKDFRSVNVLNPIHALPLADLHLSYTELFRELAQQRQPALLGLLSIRKLQAIVRLRMDIKTSVIIKDIEQQAVDHLNLLFRHPLCPADSRYFRKFLFHFAPVVTIVKSHNSAPFCWRCPAGASLGNAEIKDGSAGHQRLVDASVLPSLRAIWLRSHGIVKF